MQAMVRLQIKAHDIKFSSRHALPACVSGKESLLQVAVEDWTIHPQTSKRCSTVRPGPQKVHAAPPQAMPDILLLVRR